MMNPERQKEIDAATPEKPVRLTREEMLGMNQNKLKVGVGEGRYTGIPNEEGKKNIARVKQMKHAGYSNAEIAEHMGVQELTIQRMGTLPEFRDQ
jgi:predicted transposase YdaD